MKRRVYLSRAEMEEQVLQRLKDGLLDGIIGHDNVIGERICRDYIKDGRPYMCEFPAGCEPVEEVVKIVKEFETDEGKLWFLRNCGWRMDDVYACLYSHVFKRSGGL